MSKSLKIQEDTPYTVKGHMEGSGYKFNIRHCYNLNDIWYRPVEITDGEEMKEMGQPDEHDFRHGIGWDYIPFADDAIIESWDKEEK